MCAGWVKYMGQILHVYNICGIFFVHYIEEKVFLLRTFSALDVNNC